MKWLVTFLVLTLVILGAKAEEITTGNLITNGNFETGNSNGWTTSGDVQVLNDCCELNNVPSNYDVEFGDSGSINQDFDLSSDTITQNMLDNGITLDSTIEVQNGECNVTGCWGGQGNADTFTNKLTIKDSDGNVLASNTNIRTDVTDINGANFTDRLIYNGTGSSVGNIDISATDANAPANLGGPNVDNVSVTMTYDSSVLDNEIVEEIGEVFEDLEDVFEYIEFVEIEEMFEEIITFFTEPPVLEEMMPEEELSFEPMLMVIEEMPIEEEIVMSAEPMMKEEIIEEEPKLIFLGAATGEEEIIEETTEIITSFLPPPTAKEEEMIEEKEMLEEESMIEEEFAEEEPTKMASTSSKELKEEKEEFIEEESEEVVEESNEEEVKEEKPTSKTTKTAKVKNENNTKQKNIQSKETIKANLIKIMDKVDKDIKDISKNLQIKNIIKLDAMVNDQVSLDLYDVPFYKSKDIYLDQIQIQDLRQLYKDKTLASYTSTDPIAIVNEKLNQINFKKKQILIELEQLKNG